MVTPVTRFTLGPTLLFAFATLASCEEAPKPSTASPGATGSHAALPASTASVPAPAAATAEAPKTEDAKPKRRLEDCPKGPAVEFSEKAVEAEIRKKLAKSDGAITRGDLKKLRSLNLSSAKLPELDVCVFTYLTGLKELFLGPGDFDDLSPIAGARELESLRASINHVRDISPLAKLSKLDRLDLGRTQVSDLKPLAALTSLTELQLDDTLVEDITPLAALKNLTSLSIQRTKVKDASALKALKKLKFLYVAGTPADEDGMTLAPIRANGTKVIAQ